MKIVSNLSESSLLNELATTFHTLWKCYCSRTNVSFG